MAKEVVMGKEKLMGVTNLGTSGRKYRIKIINITLLSVKDAERHR